MIKIQKVLCPVDFSESSTHALDYAVAFAQSYQAALELMHVVPTASYGTSQDIMGTGLYAQFMKEVEEAESARLKKLTEKVQQRYANVAMRIASGAPFLEIVRRAKEWDADLIVMGTHGRGGLTHVLIGSCAEKVVRKAPCPVLTVRHPEHDFVMP